MLGSSCMLVPSGICGNNFALLHCTWFQPTSWISSHFPIGASVAKGELLDIPQKLLFVLSMGIFKFCGVLWLTLWRMSSRITPCWQLDRCWSWVHTQSLVLSRGSHFYTYYWVGHWGKGNFTFSFYDRAVGDLWDGFCNYLSHWLWYSVSP